MDECCYFHMRILARSWEGGLTSVVVCYLGVFARSTECGERELLSSI